MTTIKTNLTEDQMLQFTGGGKCADVPVQRTLLAVCGILSVFCVGVGILGMAYYAYCNND